MVLATFQIERADFEIFKSKVGPGNVSKVLRNYVSSYTDEEKDINEAILKKKFLMAKERKQREDLIYNQLKTQLDKIENDRNIQEIKQMEEAKKMAEEEAMMRAQTAKTFLSELIPDE